jgi:hypothetical protein
MYSNSLVGTIPTELGLLSSLGNMDVDTNSLTGIFFHSIILYYMGILH